MEALKSDLKETTLYMDCAHNVCSCPDEVEKLANEYNSALSKLIDKHTPRKTKTVRTRTSTPWYSSEICAARKLKRKLERKWRKTGLPEDFKAFKAQCFHVTYMMNDARRIFYTDFIAENSADQGKLFRAAKKLLAKKEVPHFPEYCDNTVIANEIGRFFARKIDLIRSEIDANGPMNSEDQVMNNSADSNEDNALSSFLLLTESDMRDIIHRSARKSCEFDPMPTSLVLSCLYELLPVITRMVNSSLACGYFPSDWKEALVNPLLKKDDLPHEFANLRPVSNLQFISKLTERAVFDQVHRHMIEYSLYPALQSAYRKGHSTETALLKVTNDILMNMDRQHVTLLVMLDLSAAFDTVNHEILLNRLDSRVGVKGQVLKWFASYRTNRSLRVSFGQALSEKFELSYGVPQGSCLGPLIYTIYASELRDIIEKHLPDAHTYADDTQLYLSFRPAATSSQADAIAAMEACIKDIRAWMSRNKLMLNTGKTEVMIISTRQQLAKVELRSLHVGDVEVSPVGVVRNLGTWLDENMNMVTHINKTCKASYFHLYNIRRIRNFLTKQATETLVHALIMGRVDYCNSLLFGLPSIHLSKLQRIQNSAARLVCSVSLYELENNAVLPRILSIETLRTIQQRTFKKICIMSLGIVLTPP